MRVTYESERGFSLVADVRQCDFEEIMRLRKDENESSRRKILRSVVKSLEQAATLLSQGYVPTDDERADIANDVGIWLSYEVAAGRATFVPTVEA